MKMMKTAVLGALAAAFCAGAAFAADALKAQDSCKAQGEPARLVPEKLTLTQEWDKTFPKSDKVDHRKVTFVNRFGITLAADLYTPKGMTGRVPALVVTGPFGAVKEQCAGLYAQIMAERGFATLAVDPSFIGESGGNVRYFASPDINTEDISAAVDFLSVQEFVDAEKIGQIGICGWG
ncbi:MAG: alpha/beta hydrolase, partial [Pyramidobacter sp.]|nr:alpha/beta hydrolase [Pyramidobacter sp.]